MPLTGGCPLRSDTSNDRADHSAAGYYFSLSYDVPETSTAQANWRFCTKCYGQFFFGYPTNGRCPAGNEHKEAGYNFVLTHS